MKVCQLSLLIAALFVGALLGVSPACAAGGLPSDSTLAAMGLSDLRVMSDSEGLTVRGLGYNGASAAGKSFAVVSSHGATAGSTNSYNAKGNKFAAGANGSYAGVEVETGGGHNNGGGYGSSSKGGHGGGHGNDCNVCQPQSIKIKAFSGGSSFGVRK